MRTCNEALIWALAMVLTLTTTLGLGGAHAAGVATPYGAVSLPFELHQVPDAPVYYVLGRSGVPGAENEGHTSNAGFVVTPGGVVVFDALGTPALGFRLLQRIREVTSQPVVRIVLSHYHADHVYGLQAFSDHAGQPSILAQRLAAGYAAGDASGQGEDAERRLAQRREALWPWVDEKTRIVPPTEVFDEVFTFEVGGISFEVRHLGPAHAPGDSVMFVKDYGVLFSGDIVYKGRIPFLDSPETNVFHWLDGLKAIEDFTPPPRFVIPGHGEPSQDVAEAVRATRNYIDFVIEAMQPAVDDFVPFDQAYRNVDWSPFADMPAFDASNRGNAYRVYLELEARSFQ